MPLWNEFHPVDIPAGTFQQQKQTANFQTAAGGAGAGTYHHQQHDNGLGEGGPQVKVRSGIAGGCHNGSNLKRRMTQGIFNVSEKSVYVNCNRTDTRNNYSRIKS